MSSTPTPDAREASPAVDADVVIVGYGPVGQSLAALLGAAGHHVVVCERRNGRYETPRAGHFDHEIMRIFQSLGIADEVRRIADPAHLYEFLAPDGEVIARLPRTWDAPSGWEASYHFYQPELEDVLGAAVAALPTVDVRYGSAVVDVRQGDDGRTTVVLEDGHVLTARVVVGADGANSVVRALSGIATEDLGFRGDWLVVDVRPREGAPTPDIPHTGQVLDPARPNHMGRVAQRWFRWEFMLMDGDDPAEMVTPERAWELISPWIAPADGELIRQTVYQFRSIVAETFRRGSVLLAGDAAHVMPPFLGQGMSSGVRDAATLSWILDLVLRGAASPELLDLYTDSRRPQVRTYVEESMRIGAVVCETDPVAARQRHDAMRAATEVPPPFQPPVGAGFRAEDPLAGRLAVQPLLLTDEGKTERADDVLGGGFTLYSSAPLDEGSRAAAAELEQRIGLRTATLAEGGLTEEGSAMADWMGEAGVVAVLVRPDFYVYGSASAASGIAGLLTSVWPALSLK